MDNKTEQTTKKYYDHISVGNRTKQICYFVEQHDKITHLDLYLQEFPSSKLLLLTKSKKTADTLGEFFKEKENKVSVIHGNHRASQLEDSQEAFNANELEILITTNKIYEILELKGITKVLNFDLPQEADSYFKTLRAVDEVGEAISFVNIDEEKMLETIEFMMRADIKKEELEAFTHTPLPKNKHSKKDKIKKPRHKKVPKRAEKKLDF